MLCCVRKTKVCTGCGKRKRVTSYYTNSQMADGCLNRCKECFKAERNAYRAANIEEHRRRDRQRYYEQPELRKQRQEANANIPIEKRREYQARFRAKNPEKQRALDTLKNALRRGKVKRKPCRKCGSTHRMYAHHKDYGQPFKVTWLCGKCHGFARRLGA